MSIIGIDIFLLANVFKFIDMRNNKCHSTFFRWNDIYYKYVL